MLNIGRFRDLGKGWRIGRKGCVDEYESYNQLIIQNSNGKKAMNTEEDYDFRNTRWGMSKEDVLASESGKPARFF